MAQAIRALDRGIYQSPFVERYASDKALRIFSDDTKFKTWRQVWTAYNSARLQMNAGVTSQQVEEMRRGCDVPIDYASAREFEIRFGHDVIAHLNVFAEVCPLIGTKMHDRMTSCGVTDNADLIIIRSGLRHISLYLARTIHHLSRFTTQYAGIPVLGFTHLKEATPVSVGKRACLWIRDLVMMLDEVQRFTRELQLLGLKGATGNQGTFLSLFDGDLAKVQELEEFFAKELKFSSCYPIAGQTYSRLIDARLITILSLLGSVAKNIGWNLRFWAHLGEVTEPFGDEHRGSSAMPFKINPKYAERLCGIGRYLMFLCNPALDTYSEQVFERTLDDSVSRRLFIPESFLAADSALRIMQFIFQDPQVNEGIIQANLAKMLPLMATERILAAMVDADQERETVYARLREYAYAVLHGGSSSFAELLMSDELFAPVHDRLESFFDPASQIGAAEEQSLQFVERVVQPALAEYDGQLDERVELEV